MRHIYPTPDVFVHHLPAIEQDVDEATWQELQTYTPAPFTLEAPAGVTPKAKKARKPNPAPAAAPTEE